MAAMAWARDMLGFGATAPKTAQEHSRQHHSPTLIPKLKAEHGELLKLYAEIEKLAVDGMYASIPAALAAFKSKFDLHTLNENLHFYCYIERKLAGNDDDEGMIRSFRTEMNAIARGVVNFVKKYRMNGVRPSNGNDFLTELRQVGSLLIHRVEREESELYLMYTP